MAIEDTIFEALGRTWWWSTRGALAKKVAGMVLSSDWLQRHDHELYETAAQHGRNEILLKPLPPLVHLNLKSPLGDASSRENEESAELTVQRPHGGAVRTSPAKSKPKAKRKGKRK